MTIPDTEKLEAVRDWWQTSVSRVEPNVIELRGYPIDDLIGAISFVDTIWLMVTGEVPTPGQSHLLEAALVSSVDHGPQAPSISVARMAVTCGLSLNGAVASAVNTLDDVHGGAGQQCVALLYEIADRSRTSGTAVDDIAEEVVAEYRERGDFVPGFGHRFHTYDPRRDALVAEVRAAVASGDVSGTYLEAALAIERALARGRSRPVPMNIDAATAIVYAELGCAPELARGLFVLSRAVGVVAHAWEERGNGSRIKGPMPKFVNPRYTGPATRRLSHTRATEGDTP